MCAPKGLKHVLCLALSGLGICDPDFPGRRFALPWAGVLSPFQGLVFVILFAQGEAARLTHACWPASERARLTLKGSRAVAAGGASRHSETRNPWEGVSSVALAPEGRWSAHARSVLTTLCCGSYDADVEACDVFV